MLGKASEIATSEMYYDNLGDWLESNPDLIIIDIKYSNDETGRGAVLVIYKLM